MDSRRDAVTQGGTKKERNAGRRERGMPVPAVFVPSFVLTFVPSLPSVPASLREIESSVYSGLARDYGSFMLRNALAISLALDIEDGELGF
jgi:hypothetical protein